MHQGAEGYSGATRRVQLRSRRVAVEVIRPGRMVVHFFSWCPYRQRYGQPRLGAATSGDPRTVLKPPDTRKRKDRTWNGDRALPGSAPVGSGAPLAGTRRKVKANIALRSTCNLHPITAISTHHSPGLFLSEEAGALRRLPQSFYCAVYERGWRLSAPISLRKM